MRIVTDHAARLTGAGFTPPQAAALNAAVHTTAGEAVEALGEQLRQWHIYLALYLLIQIGVVLLAILLLQAAREPAYPARAALAGHPGGLRTASETGDSW